MSNYDTRNTANALNVLMSCSVAAQTHTQTHMQHKQ